MPTEPPRRGNVGDNMIDRSALRPATTADQDLISTLLAASYPKLMPDSYSREILDVALPLMTTANTDLLRSGTFYVIQNGGGPALGCGGWTKERPGSGEISDGLAHLRHFATHPDWIGHGIGRIIYSQCEADARLAGVGSFEVYSSLNAEQFYTALGFVAEEQFDVVMSADLMFPSVRMRRAI